MASFRALPGFRDFYPAEMALRRHVEQAWHAASRAAGFEEIDGPPLELLDLFRAKSGDEIVGQLYNFVDKGGREVALRAELTPSLARMVAARAAALRKPIKWYSVPQLFRYERQQRGRLREHIQWNVDVVGAPEVGADAELLAVALDALRRLGLTERHLSVRVFDRRVAEGKLRELGVEDLQAALTLIDRGLVGSEAARETLTVAVDAALADWLEEPVAPEGEFGEFLAACEDYGLGDYLQPDKHIVRGLAYYTGVVFEIFDRGRELRAVAGGGRYDDLIERLGGPALAATGFGMGDVVLSELLKDHGLLPDAAPSIDYFLAPMGPAAVPIARRWAGELRRDGKSAAHGYGPLGANRAIRAGKTIGAKHVILVPGKWSGALPELASVLGLPGTVLRAEDAP